MHASDFVYMKKGLLLLLAFNKYTISCSMYPHVSAKVILPIGRTASFWYVVNRQMNVSVMYTNIDYMHFAVSILI